MPSVASIAKIQKTPECRLFYPGHETGFRVELRRRKIYLIQDGQELGRVAGILLDRAQTHDSQLLLTPKFDAAAELADMLGPRFLSPVIRRNGFQNLPQQHAKNNLRVKPLTRREKEVLRLIEAGLSTREIAAELVISPSTVKRHIATIFGKLGANRRTQAVAVANSLAIL